MSEVTERKQNKSIEGVVTSDVMNKTIVVTVTRLIEHPVVHKYVKRYTRYFAHDESNEAKKGDKVEIHESRPISKKKRWRLAKILETTK
jgi:small subunit ribosomal protein S17